MYLFQYHRPGSVAEAATMLKANDEAKLLAGGMTYIPTLKQRLAQPSDLIDLGRIGELKVIREEGDRLVIGAMTTHAEVAGAEAVRRLIPALAKLASGIGDPQVRNCGTIGGSIANNDPAADYPAGVVGLNATVKTDRREIRADDFFTGMFETALEPDEIVVSVSFPKPERAAYLKFPNPASRYALAGVCVAQTGGQTRVAVTGAAPCVFRASELEQALASNFSPEAIKDIRISAADLNTDIHASADYRAHLVTVMAQRAVAAAG